MRGPVQFSGREGAVGGGPCAYAAAAASFIAEVFMVWNIPPSSVPMEGGCQLVARQGSGSPGRVP